MYLLSGALRTKAPLPFYMPDPLLSIRKLVRALREHAHTHEHEPLSLVYYFAALSAMEEVWSRTQNTAGGQGRGPTKNTGLGSGHGRVDARVWDAGPDRRSPLGEPRRRPFSTDAGPDRRSPLGEPRRRPFSNAALARACAAHPPAACFNIAHFF